MTKKLRVDQLRVCDNAKIRGKLLVGGDVHFKADLEVDGTTTTSNLIVTDAITLPNIVNVANLNVTQTLNVAGTSNLTNVNVAQNLNVAGTTNLADINSSGTANLTNVNVAQDLTVTGTSNLGDVNVTGTANVGDVNVNGDLSLNGLTVLPDLKFVLSKAVPNYVVPSNILVDKHMFRVLEKTYQGGVTIPDLFATAPIGTIANPPGLVNLDALTISIQNPPSVAPWYFKALDAVKFPTDPLGQVVLFGGIPDIYANPYSYNDIQPPVSTSITSVNLTLNQPGLVAVFNLFVRYSVEEGFDFLNVLLNGTTIFSGTGLGPSPTNPYLGTSLPITMLSGDVLTIQMNKDQIVYGGVDNIYFYILNFQVVPIPRSTTFRVRRNNVTIYDFGFAIDLNNIENGNVIKEFEYQAGDIIQLISSNSYGTFTVRYIGTL